MDRLIRVLLVEDEQMLSQIISDTLSGRGFEIVLAKDGLEGTHLCNEEKFDVIVSDIMMPNLDGFSFVRNLRASGVDTPVLFLTARSATDDVVKGFELGGNDYLKKPFAIEELIIRIKSLAGRVGKGEQTLSCIKIGEYKFLPDERSLERGGEKITLAARETAVLLQLCNKMGEIVGASALLRDLWGDDNFFNLRSLNVYISRLRKLLAQDPAIEIISHRSVGYQLRVKETIL